MAAWRLARSLETFRGQVNTYAPRRSKASDGTIGDVAHQKAGTSDHLPTRSGQVCAFDLTHDPAGGCDAHAAAERLLRAQDPRLKYVISNGRIGSGPAGVQPGRWRPYKGANRHEKHAHISVVAGALGDDARPWAGIAPAPAPAARVTKVAAGSTTAHLSTGEDDDEMSPEDRALLQRVDAKLDNLLGQFGYTIENGVPAWRGVETWDGRKGADGKARRLTFLDLMRETHRELLQVLPARGPETKADTMLGLVLNVAAALRAGGTK